MAGVGTFPLNGLALHPPLLKRYVNTLFITMLGAVVIRLASIALHHPQFQYGYLMPILPILHWFLLLRAGGTFLRRRATAWSCCSTTTS